MMKRILFLLITIGIVSCDKPDNSTSARGKQLVVNVSADKQGEPISSYLYGMFIEPLGNVDVGDLIDDAIWAEMIDDRKFFYPVDQNDKQIPVNKRNNPNQWEPFDDPKTVVMDSLKKYVGIHSPRIKTNKSSRQGIVQKGVSVIQGKKYEGRIVLSGDPGIPVTVSLVWGEGETGRSSVTINKLESSYKKYPLTFESHGANTNARIEITGTGEGSFSVGAISLMPEDNVDGFRPDVIKLLRDLNSKIYRWGGNMTSGFDWRDGIGDPDLRAPRYEYAWDCMETNDVGTHELVKFANLINVELALTVNAGLGDAYSAAQWVEYTNGGKETPMGKLRAQNGHPEPFNIKLWCVGNESYGWWQLGHTDLKSYIIKHNMFAEKMLAVDPTIMLIASGAALEEMTITGSSRKETGKIEAEYDSASDWSGGLLRKGHNISFMSEHFYCAVDQQFDYNKGKYVNIDEPLEEWTRRPANRVKMKAENYHEYHRRIPGSKNIPVYIDEWTYFTNWVHPTPTMGVTLGHARGLHEMFRNTDLIKMAGFTFGTSCLSFTDTDAIYNSTGMLFKLFQSQLGSIPLVIEGNSSQPAPKWPGHPTVNAGGDTFPLDIVATLTGDKKFLVLSVVNPTESEQSFTLKLNGATVGKAVHQIVLSGTSSSARNIVNKPEEVFLKEKEIESSDKFTVEKASVTIFRYILE